MTLSTVRAIASSMALLCVVSAGLGQQPGTGSVSGVVTCSDTLRPARFAKVVLTPVKSDKPAAPAMSTADAKADPAATMKAISALLSSVTMLQTQTGLDGTYKLDDVAPGDYYLAPSAPGYVSPMAVAATADDSSAKAMAGVPMVHVEADRTTRGDAVLERGAALSGTVVFDDGSPAAGVMVRFELAKEAAKAPGDGEDMASVSRTMSLAMSGGLVLATTDDRGRFRLAGVAAGEYIVQATVTLRSGFSMRAGVMDMGQIKGASALIFYAPGTLHRKDAARFSVHVGDERSDIEVKVDLAGMHTVAGRVASAVDHHGLNQATVTLTDNTDKKFQRTAVLDTAGSFTVSYVPAGSYTLEVSDAADTEPAKKQPAGMLRIASIHTLKSYDDSAQPLLVAAGDVTGVSVEMKESKTVKKDFDVNQLIGGMAGGSAKE